MMLIYLKVFFFYMKYIDLKLGVLRRVPGAQDVDVIPRAKLCPSVIYEGLPRQLHPPLSTPGNYTAVSSEGSPALRQCSSLPWPGLTTPDSWGK